MTFFVTDFFTRCQNTLESLEIVATNPGVMSELVSDGFLVVEKFYPMAVKILLISLIPLRKNVVYSWCDFWVFVPQVTTPNTQQRPITACANRLARRLGEYLPQGKEL